jgi:aminotransferase
VPHRDELAHYLLENDVYTTLRYHPLHLNSLYRQTDVRLLNSEQLNEDCLSIPIHPRLTSAEVEKIVSLIKAFGASRSL